MGRVKIRCYVDGGVPMTRQPSNLSRQLIGHLLVVALLSSLFVLTSASPVSASTTDGPTL